MAEQRFKNRVWALGNHKGRIANWEKVAVAVLMDVRDELQEIKAILRPAAEQKRPARKRAAKKRSA